MKIKFLFGTIGIGLFLAAVFGIYSMKQSDELHANAEFPQVVDVDELAMHPDHFFQKGSIGVTGKVVKVDASQSVFVLGCEDACVMVPVKYSRQMPHLENQVVVYGQIKAAEDGRYVFEGRTVQEQ